MEKASPVRARCFLVAVLSCACATPKARVEAAVPASLDGGVVDGEMLSAAQDAESVSSPTRGVVTDGSAGDHARSPETKSLATESGDEASRLVSRMLRRRHARDPETWAWLRQHPSFVRRIPAPTADDVGGVVVIPIAPACFYPCKERFSCERGDVKTECPESLPGHDSPRMFDLTESARHWDKDPSMCCFIEKYDCGPRQCADL